MNVATGQCLSLSLSLTLILRLYNLPQKPHVCDNIPQRTIPLAEPHHLPFLVAVLVLVQGDQQLHHLLAGRLAIVFRGFVAATREKEKRTQIKSLAFNIFPSSFYSHSLSVVSALKRISPVIPSRSLVLVQCHLAILIDVVLDNGLLWLFNIPFITTTTLLVPVPIEILFVHLLWRLLLLLHLLI